MRVVEKNIRAAFVNGVPFKSGNSYTDGQAVYLHGNKIIEKRSDGV